MTVTTTGKEMKRFYADDAFWLTPNGRNIYQDDCVFKVNGEETYSLGSSGEYSDTDKIEILSGYTDSTDTDYKKKDLLDFFKAWKETQKTTTLLASIPNEKLTEIKALIQAAGGTILV